MAEQKKCVACGEGKLEKGFAPAELKIGEHTIRASINAELCRKCDEAYFANEDLKRFELLAAIVLVSRGAVGGEAFKFIRKALGIRAADFAELIDVSYETVSRWETGKTPITRTAWVTLACLAVDAYTGSDHTMALLKVAAEPRPPKKRVELGQVDVRPDEEQRAREAQSTLIGGDWLDFLEFSKRPRRHMS
jgi:putative zinc finger/helix-turn-helix YgiT family protein